jgi:release factor glutamine methyltransferase
MPSLSKIAFHGDFVFRVCEDVYEPAEDTFLLADNLEVKTDDSVLDIGTGCGILAILAAARGSNVVATDLNPRAILCAKENAKSNQVLTRLHFIKGDLFQPIRKKQAFDVILFNPPYLPVKPKEPNSWLETAWSGGISGREITDRFIHEAHEYLKPTGCVFLIQSTLSGIEKAISMFAKENMKATIAVKQECPFFETLILLRVKHSES